MAGKRKTSFTAQQSRIHDIRFSSRLKPRHNFGSVLNIGRQSRPDLRDFTRKCEILRDSEKSRLCHFFRAMALKFAFYTTIRRKGGL